MVSKLTMSLFFNIAWAFPLFLWNTPQDEIKNGFYRFILGLSTILWGMACILLYFNIVDTNSTLFNFGLAVGALLLIGSFTAIIWNKVNISLFQIPNLILQLQYSFCLFFNHLLNKLKYGLLIFFKKDTTRFEK